jgi:serine protease inhibitor
MMLSKGQWTEVTVPTANLKFAHKIYPELVKAKGDDANLIMSPFSVNTVMAMAMAGAKGDTKEQMRRALCLGNDDNAVFEGYPCSLARILPWRLQTGCMFKTNIPLWKNTWR